MKQLVYLKVIILTTGFFLSSRLLNPAFCIAQKPNSVQTVIFGIKRAG
jgi:hypothetical protein